MSDWKNEDDIKAELRVLTGDLKQLREELRTVASPPKQNPSRAFLHRQSWPPAEPRPATAPERKPARRTRATAKKKR